jgi:hypothetical protein
MSVLLAASPTISQRVDALPPHEKKMPTLCNVLSHRLEKNKSDAIMALIREKTGRQLQ